MNKNRYINTSFWEDEYVGNLSSDEKLLFIYLLTSQLSNIAGMYPITIRRITFDTGMTKERIINAFDTFKSSRKILFIGQKFVVITNFIKHQKWNPNIQKGILSTVNDLPEYVKLALDMDLDKPFKSFTSLLRTLNYSNSNSNTNTNKKEYIKEKNKDKKNIKKKTNTYQKPKNVEDQIWEDFKRVRSAKRAPITTTAMEGIEREAIKANIGLNGALKVIIEKNWQSFKAEWYKNIKDSEPEDRFLKQQARERKVNERS